MTVHPVQYTNPGGPNFCPPYARIHPVTRALVHLQVAANLSAIYAETARSGVPVKTGKENPLFTPIQTISKSVPRPTDLLEQLSSVGPVPPAPYLEYAADGDQTLLNFFPLTTVATLEYQELATIFLHPSGPDHQYLSATGNLLEVTDTARHYILAIYLLDSDSLFRLNAHLWTLLNAAFDLSAFTALCPTFSAAHVYKFLLILLYNMTHYARVWITKAIQMLPTSQCSNSEELASLHSSVVAYSVLHNILNSKFALTPLPRSCIR